METYQFSEALYIVASEQQLHFKQLFQVFALMGYQEYADRCKHIYYGLVLDSEGKKMGSRKGNSLTLIQLLEEGIAKSRKVIEEKGIEIENKDELAKKIGIGAIIFNTLFNTKYKDSIFDWESVLNFNGETGPYVQYTYVRTKSVLNKAEYIPNLEDVKFELYQEKEAIEVIKLLGNFKDVILDAAGKYEPAVISRYLIDLSQAFSNFYNECRIIIEDQDLQNARLYLCYACRNSIKDRCLSAWYGNAG